MTKLTRRQLLYGAGALALAVAGTETFLLVRRGRPENIILVVADAMRADCIGKSINGQEITPNLNSLAAQSVCFRNAYSPSSFTKTSMASILSGMYAPGHKVENHIFALPDCMTIPKFLAEQGYFCAGVVTNPFMKGEVGPGRTSKRMDFGFNAPFDDYRYIDSTDVPTTGTDFAQYGAGGNYLNDDLVKRTLDIKVRDYSNNRPLFLYLHYMDTHQPWLKTPKPGVTGRFHKGNKSIEDVFEEDAELIRKAVIDTTFDKSKLSDEDIERLKAIYYEAAFQFDSYFGQLEGILKERKMYENTTWIVTADHGDELMEHGTIGHGQNLFSASLRVPLIIKRAGIKPGLVGQRVTNAMILPTIMDWFGRELNQSTLESLTYYVNDPRLGDYPVFASLDGQDRIILPDGKSVMDYTNPTSQERSRIFLDISTDPAEKSPIAPDPLLVKDLERARGQANQKANEAGVRVRFSSRLYANEIAKRQNEIANALEAKGEITPEEASRLKSEGHFIPEEERRRILTRAGIETTKNMVPTNKEERDQLRALGYLN